MKAAVVTEWGATPRYADFPDPQPRDGAVVATVEAAALTNLTRGLVSTGWSASKTAAACTPARWRRTA